MTQMDPVLIAGLQEQLKREAGAAADRRREAADKRVSIRRSLNAAAEHDERAAQFRQLLRIADPEHAALYAEPKGGEPDWPRRTAIIAGLREALDFLEENPDLPVERLTSSLVLFPRGGDEIASEAEVDRIARILGVPSGRSQPNRHYRAERRFGPGGHVTLESYTCGRTMPDWNEGDPYPDWWPTGEAIEAARQHAEAAVDESQRVVDAFLDGQSEVDQLLVEEELARQAETEAKALGWCGAKAVDSEGQIGRCVLHKGHDERGSGRYVARLEGAHFDPAFGHWDATGTVRRAAHVESDEKPGTCRHCDSTVPGKGYCVFAPSDAESAAEPARDESLDERMVSMGALGEVDVW